MATHRRSLWVEAGADVSEWIKTRMVTATWRTRGPTRTHTHTPYLSCCMLACVNRPANVKAPPFTTPLRSTEKLILHSVKKRPYLLVCTLAHVAIPYITCNPETLHQTAYERQMIERNKPKPKTLSIYFIARLPLRSALCSAQQFSCKSMHFLCGLIFT